jgi:hypothetical protein
VGIGAAGVVAAGYAVSGPAKAAMSFDERVGLLANTAYVERDVNGRKLGDAQIIAAIKNAVANGMTKDAAMDALDQLVKEGKVGGVAGALELLPYIGKVATGSGSGGREVSALMGGFIGSKYAADVPEAKRMMGIASAAATAGAFEKNDMAKYLPGLLPLAKTVGLTGEDGFRKLMVLLQQSMTTAGDASEAAQNVRNLLSKLQSNDTAIDFKKAGRGDLYKYMMDQRAKGIDPLTAWQNVIDQEIEKNPNLKPAVDKVKNAKSKEDQDAAIAALTGMAEGQSIGKFFQDMQAKGAVFGMRNREIEKKVYQALGLSESIVETDFQNMADRAGVKTRVASERVDLAKYDAVGGLTPAISKAAETFGDLASKFPVLTGSAVLATTALTTMAGAAGLATLAMGGKGGAAITRAAATATKSTANFKKFGLATTIAGASLSQFGDEDSASVRYGSAALTGAGLGAMFGPIGAVIGAAGALAIQGVVDSLKPKEEVSPKGHMQLDINLPPGVTVKSQNVYAPTNLMVSTNTGSLWSTP